MDRASGIPSSVGALTPAWLTAVLGVGAATVRETALTHIGADQGFTGGRLHRIGLTWDRAGGGPASVVAKRSPADPAMRALMQQANANEVAFYHAAAAEGALPIPRCHRAAADPATGESVLLLEDLTGHRRVGLAQGAGPREAGAVVTALAAVHARWWNRPPLPAPGGSDLCAAMTLATCWPRYARRLSEMLPDVALPGWFETLGARLAATAWAADTGPITLLHRDPHVENVLFAADGAAVLLDWQFVGRGPGAFDVGYFLISSLPPDQRRATEQALVAQYHAALMQAGVAGYTAEACWCDYLRSVAGKLWLTVVATVAFDNEGAGKAEYRRADLERLIAFCADHGVGEATFLEGDCMTAP